MKPKAWVTKAKIDKWNYIKLNSFCTEKQQNKKATYRREQIFVDHIPDMELIAKIYEELLQQARV